MEGREGIEPTTSALQVRRSTTELPALYQIMASRPVLFFFLYHFASDITH